jgi:hypothetical protein
MTSVAGTKEKKCGSARRDKAHDPHVTSAFLALFHFHPWLK